jgi:hypothetical protein
MHADIAGPPHQVVHHGAMQDLEPSRPRRLPDDDLRDIVRVGEIGLGLQHWFSPQVEIRPEVTYYRSFNAPAFNGNFNATPTPIAPNKSYMWLFAGDIIFHF